MSNAPSVVNRQIWGLLPASSSTSAEMAHCTPFSLPSKGVLAFGDITLTLTTDAIFKPECTGLSLSDVSTISGHNDPFYASTIPQTYAVAAATVIAWILVVMLVITPRTNFLGQSGTAPGFSTGHGIIGGSTGGNTDLIGIGSRPWLQKIAATTVAISLTIATADTFKFAQKQYASGYMDANQLRNDVLGSIEIRTTRVITDVFLWLAQVQTLIRLFPRHKEKVLIKWIGFALILFDSVFSCLNSFLFKNKNQHTPRQFIDAIPALSYLFELALGLLYAAWVIYYSLTKRRYAFYHPKMTSISLIALLSIVAILTPVVFFVTDVSNKDVAGWGDYFRWVGAAAASVVVWEWVERIEALERDEKKDGILGREIFDGDEMLDVNPSNEIVWAHSRYDRNRYRRDGGSGGSGGSEAGDTQASAVEKGLGGVARRFRPRPRSTRLPSNQNTANAQSSTTGTESDSATKSGAITFGPLPRPREQEEVIPPSPSRVISPVSRTDTTSAASTVYVVQYNPAADVPQPVRREVDPNGNTEQERAQARARQQQRHADVHKSHAPKNPEKEEFTEDVVEELPSKRRGNGLWLPVTNPFKRKRASPPVEIQQARQVLPQTTSKSAKAPTHNFSRWDLKNRMGVLAAETGEKWRERGMGTRHSEDVPVIVIPAQPRGSGRTWKPPESPPRPVAEAVAGAESSPASSDQGLAATTLTANTDALSTSPEHPTTRNIPPSVIQSATGMSVQSNQNPPPRADDIRPLAGSTSPVIIPAPRRSAQSSPLAQRQASTASAASGSGAGSKSQDEAE